MISFNPLMYASLAGVLPALLWLLFWLREDRKNPEPKGLIARTFLFGMLSVIAVLPFQKAVEMLIPHSIVYMLFWWAVLEELFKYIAGHFGGLSSREDNEPIDPLIYMITAALGFVALENTLFILSPILGNNLSQSVITGNMRFIGASLLHVVTSGMVGVALSFSFYKSIDAKVRRVILALILAISFHTLFNYFILKFGEKGAFISFLSVWVGVIALLLAFEKAKAIAPKPQKEL